MHRKRDTLVLSLAQAECTISDFEAGATRHAVTHIWHPCNASWEEFSVFLLAQAGLVHL